MRTQAVGDVHGCHSALTALLREVRPVAEDRIIFLGNYIDRGPDSRGVIETLLKLQSRCKIVFLRGNHELMMLDARESVLKADVWQSCGGFETLISYAAEYRKDWEAAIPEAHWAFFEQTVRSFETPNQIFVHGSLDPDLDLKEQPDWVVFWEYFDRVRPHKSGKRIVCGHTPQRKGLIADVGHAACIDTGAVTAVGLPVLRMTPTSTGKRTKRVKLGLGNWTRSCRSRLDCEATIFILNAGNHAPVRARGERHRSRLRVEQWTRRI
jgi:serine/threonine protein phosphatase 1